MEQEGGLCMLKQGVGLWVLEQGLVELVAEGLPPVK